jgi:hypothetical protein
VLAADAAARPNRIPVCADVADPAAKFPVSAGVDCAGQNKGVDAVPGSRTEQPDCARIDLKALPFSYAQERFMALLWWQFLDHGPVMFANSFGGRAIVVAKHMRAAVATYSNTVFVGIPG